ncbi:MAG TPA: oligoendopeptidase F [Tenericutes bacterium]|nr:oligoendopeptidase F [Mycoplasmatota bacterium]
MENKILDRHEVDSIYKWNLQKMYHSFKDWEEDYNNTLKDFELVKKYKNKIMKSSKNLYNLLENYFNVSRKIENLYIYASMKNDEDTTNNDTQTLKGKIENLYMSFEEITSFIVPEILKNDYSKVEKFLNENEKLRKYKFFLEEEFRAKKHILNENEEKILSSLSMSLSNANKTASYLRNSDMKLGFITDENGNNIELSDSNYNVFINSKNREVRKNAFNTMYKSYSNLKNTFASTLSGHIETEKAIAKIRNYNSSLEMKLFSGNIPIDVYNNLIEVVNENLEILHKYYDLKQKMLDVEELHLYDVYVNLVEYEETYSFEKAKKEVIESLSILGEDYIKNINKAFNENWIDIYENRGKRSGAYSWGSYDSDPYILLNYQNRLKDVSTLAHELGHSIHSYYSKRNNDYHEANYKIFVAEVASTVNELLLCNHMLKNTDNNNKKLFILNELMELFRATIYRQTMFAEFEQQIHKKCEDGEILTSEFISDIYLKLNEKYFGKNVFIDEQIKYEWARIPHFYTSFYVYQYATGLSAACYIVERILNNEENSVKDYLDFLKTGGSDYPINELKIAGVDMNDKKVIESAIKMFDNIIEEFKSLI